MSHTDKLVRAYVRTFKQAKRMARTMRAIPAPSFAREAEAFATHNITLARRVKNGNA